MKRTKLTTIFAAVLAVIALGISGCGQANGRAQAVGSAAASPPASAPDRLAQIQAKGEIVIATEGTWAPWTYHDESDRLVGFDVEVARLVAEKLGVKATFVEGEWDGLLAGVTSGRYDLMANGVEVTEERAETYGFTEPYAYIRTALIVDGGNNAIRSFEDLDGKQTANTLASTYAALAERYGATAVGVDDLNQTIELLLAGRVDATLNAEVTYYDYLKAHPDANLKIAALTDDASRVSFPVRKGADSRSLLTAVNKALAELGESGELSELSVKYFGSDLSRLQPERIPPDSSSVGEHQTSPDSGTEAPPESAPPERNSTESLPEQAAAQAPGDLQASAGAATDGGTPVTLEVGGRQFAATLSDNPSAQALAAMLPLTLPMRDVNGNEKAHYFSDGFPTNPAQPGQIRSGDLMLYGSDCLVLFYDSFPSPYSYTRLGALDDAAGLADALGAGDVQVTILAVGR